MKKRGDFVEVKEILGGAIVGKRVTKRCTNLLKILMTTGQGITFDIVVNALEFYRIHCMQTQISDLDGRERAFPFRKRQETSESAKESFLPITVFQPSSNTHMF